MATESGLVVDEPATASELPIGSDISIISEDAPESSPPNRLAVLAGRGFRDLLPPVLGVTVFLGLWALIAPQIETRVGSLPGPVEVFNAGRDLYGEWLASRDSSAAFYAAQDARNAEFIAAGTPELVQDFEFNGPPSFPAQIWTSVQTVALGFFIGTAIAVPVGLMSGLSSTFQKAINPLVSIFKPVSPLAWLPIVTIVVSSAALNPDAYFAPAFVISALVVTLNSLWPTLINTAVGASSVDKDLLNVGKVLKLSSFARLRKLILPSALPYIFTGMRLSLGVGWMVLIAAEMLAQNPGLGKFVWDEFQNGSSQSLSRIMFAVFVIGFIGFLLDRLMSVAESFVSRNHA